MELETRQTLANRAADRWERCYCTADAGHWSHAITPKLKALGDNPTPESVDAVIGNDRWTTPNSCSECGQEAAEVIRVGEEPNYESSTSWLCRSCVEAALRMFEAAYQEQ